MSAAEQRKKQEERIEADIVYHLDEVSPDPASLPRTTTFSRKRQVL